MAQTSAEIEANHDKRLRDLEVQMAALVSDHVRVMDALFDGDDGKRGLVAFMARQDAREEASAASWRWFRWIIGTIIAIGLLVLTGLQINKQIQQHELHWPHIFVVNSSDELSAHNSSPYYIATE